MRRRNYHEDEYFNNYLDQLELIENLSDTEEKELLKVAQKGDFYARNKIVLAYGKYVLKIISYYYNVSNIFPVIGCYQDLVSEGMEGVMKAIDKYDLNKNVKFCTYAYSYIRKYVSQYINNNKTYLPRIPEKRVRRKNAILKAIEEYEIEYGNQPSMKELSEITGEKKKTINDLLKDQLLYAISLDNVLNIGDSEEICLKDMIEDKTVNVECTAIRNVLDEEYISKLFEILPDRQERCIILEYLKDEKSSQREIAESMNCSRQNITKKLRKIQKEMKDNGFGTAE